LAVRYEVGRIKIRVQLLETDLFKKLGKKRKNRDRSKGKE